MQNRFTHDIKNKNPQIDIGVVASQPEYRKRSLGSISLIVESGYKESIFSRQKTIINSTLKNSDTFLITGFDSKRVISNIGDTRIIENVNYESTNIAEDIRLMINASLNNNLLLILGNVIPSKSSLSFDTKKSTVVTTKNDVTDISVLSLKNSVIRFNYEKTIESKWAGICYFTGKEYQHLKDICLEKNSDKIMIELLNDIVDNGHAFEVVEDNKVKSI